MAGKSLRGSVDECLNSKTDPITWTPGGNSSLGRLDAVMVAAGLVRPVGAVDSAVGQLTSLMGFFG